MRRARCTYKVTFMTLLLCLSVPCAKAVVCTFDDLPAPPAGGLANIPRGYCGINWIGEGASSSVPYSDNTFQFTLYGDTKPHTFSPHSPPQAIALASFFLSFSFNSPAVLNGFWVTPDPGSSPNAALQIRLSFKGVPVSTSAWIPIPAGGGPRFVSPGYSGQVDYVYIQGGIVRDGVQVADGPAYASIDDIDYTPNAPQCQYTISPVNASFSQSGGSGTVTVTPNASNDKSCTWSASSNNPDWITIKSTNFGMVTYTVQPNTSSTPSRQGTLTIAGQTFPITQTLASFVISDNQGRTSASTGMLTDYVEGTQLNYSGSGWPTTGPVSILGVGPSFSVAPPTFGGSLPRFTLDTKAEPPCRATISAVQDATRIDVTVKGIYLGKFVLADNPLGEAGVTARAWISSPHEIPSNNLLPLPLDNVLCKATWIDDIDYYQFRVPVGEALAIEGVFENQGFVPGPTGDRVRPPPLNIGGGIFVVQDFELPAQEILITGKVFVAGGRTLTLPLTGGRKATLLSHATAPLDADFTPPVTAQNLGTEVQDVLHGLNYAGGDLRVRGDLVLDNALLKVAGKLTIDGGIKGKGSVAVQGNIIVNGPVNLTAPDQFALVAMGDIVFNNTAPRLAADINGDGVVDCSDLYSLRASFGRKSGDLGFNPAADLNHDGVVDVRDLAIVTRALPAGTKCP